MSCSLAMFYVVNVVVDIVILQLDHKVRERVALSASKQLSTLLWHLFLRQQLKSKSAVSSAKARDF